MSFNGIIVQDITRYGEIKSLDPWDKHSNYGFENSQEKLNFYLSTLPASPSLENFKKVISWWWIVDNKVSMKYHEYALSKKYEFNGKELIPIEIIPKEINPYQLSGEHIQKEEFGYITRPHFIKAAIKKLDIPVYFNYDNWIAQCFHYLDCVPKTEELLYITIEDEIIYWANEELGKELNIPNSEVAFIKIKMKNFESIAGEKTFTREYNLPIDTIYTNGGTINSNRTISGKRGGRMRSISELGYI